MSIAALAIIDAVEVDQATSIVKPGNQHPFDLFAFEIGNEKLVQNRLRS